MIESPPGKVIIWQQVHLHSFPWEFISFIFQIGGRFLSEIYRNLKERDFKLLTVQNFNNHNNNNNYYYYI